MRVPEIKSPAEYAKQALVAGFRRFESNLRDDEEMVIDFDGLPPGHRVHAIGTEGAFLVFYSIDANEREAVTYLGALSGRVTVIAQPKPDDVPEARRIGFHTPA